jgi:hypothetical protein
MKIRLTKGALILMMMAAVLGFAGAGESFAGQSQERAGTDEGGVGIAPARFELPMLPGTEKTVVVNVYYNSASADSAPFRLVASVGDWSIQRDGSVEYYRAGTRQGSSAPWIVFSPAEMTAMPGKVHPIRVTIVVPKDATPGDHLAALFVEARPDNIKLEENRRQVVVRFRMAALFYVMVPALTTNGTLQDLRAETNDAGILVSAMLRNDGNSHVRPLHSVRITDNRGQVVAEYAETEAVPVPGFSEVSQRVEISKALAPGDYTVGYRVNFRDGQAITEGETHLVVNRTSVSAVRP